MNGLIEKKKRLKSGSKTSIGVFHQTFNEFKWNISALVALHATGSAAGRVRRGVTQEAESAYISQVANNLNTLCDGSPPEYCNCDNAPGKTTKGPYDLDDVFNLIFELFGCGPGEIHTCDI